jgi:hypothetical protein
LNELSAQPRIEQPGESAGRSNGFSRASRVGNVQTVICEIDGELRGRNRDNTDAAKVLMIPIRAHGGRRLTGKIIAERGEHIHVPAPAQHGKPNG